MSSVTSSLAIVQVSESSQVGEARRTAVRLAAGAGFSNVDQARVGIVATELGTNLVLHAKGGRLFVQKLNISGVPTIELLAIDSGSGIRNVEQALRDGFSTAGTPGAGLGAIQRQSNEFDIYSQPQQGTVVLSRIRPPELSYSQAVPVVWDAIAIPAPNELLCGDCWQVSDHDDRFSVMIADGLGHGDLAAEASRKAVDVFDTDLSTYPGKFLSAAHRSLSGTRGAAIAMACADFQSNNLKYAGVGNIAGTLLSDGRGAGCVHTMERSGCSSSKCRNLIIH
jgi:anti-sigma regulatory factor (Ser/Thr protein kinase)